MAVHWLRCLPCMENPSLVVKLTENTNSIPGSHILSYSPTQDFCLTSGHLSFPSGVLKLCPYFLWKCLIVKYLNNTKEYVKCTCKHYSMKRITCESTLQFKNLNIIRNREASCPSFREQISSHSPGIAVYVCVPWFFPLQQNVSQIHLYGST